MRGRIVLCAACAAAAGCPSLHALPPEQACLEAGYAISARTFDCTGDPELANERYLAFERRYDCVPPPEWHVEGTVTTFIAGDTGQLPFAPPDAFHCSYAIRQLPCELVETYGADLDRWLAASNACAWVVEPAGSAP